MIGLEQEPPRDVLDALNEIFGVGAYFIRYAQQEGGVSAYVVLRTNPPREWGVFFAHGLDSHIVWNLWREGVQRLAVAENFRRGGGGGALDHMASHAAPLSERETQPELKVEEAPESAGGPPAPSDQVATENEGASER